MLKFHIFTAVLPRVLTPSYGKPISYNPILTVLPWTLFSLLWQSLFQLIM